MEGRSMDVDWQTDLDRWLTPFVAALRHKTRARMCPAYIAGLIGPGTARAFSRWRRALPRSITISFIISSRAEFGTVLHSRPRC